MKLTIEIDSGALIDALTPGDARRLREALGIGPAMVTVYGSRPPHAPPPGRSYRWFSEHAPAMPGAQRSGGKRGRTVVWTIGAEAYAAWVAAKMSEQKSKSSSRDDDQTNSSDITDDDIDASIRHAGYRVRNLRPIAGGRK